MADQHLYLNLIPESLVASILPPREFGSYMAVGPKFYSRGEAIFFKLHPDFDVGTFAADTEEIASSQKRSSPPPLPPVR